jgi:pimeloyl-ACP methyl ester carboxylesterase
MGAAVASPNERLACTLVAGISRRTTKMDISSLFQQLGIALGLKTPVGSQRDSAASHLAGVRTFPPVTVLGTVCGLWFKRSAAGFWLRPVSDGITYPAIAPIINDRILASLIPQAQLHIVNSGHLFFVTRTQEIAPAIKQFLRRG